jgi:hypothetical protein
LACGAPTSTTLPRCLPPLSLEPYGCKESSWHSKRVAGGACRRGQAAPAAAAAGFAAAGAGAAALLLGLAGDAGVAAGMGAGLGVAAAAAAGRAVLGDGALGFEADRGAAGVADARTLPIRTGDHGQRYRELREAMVFRQASQFAGWPVRGPRTVSWWWPKVRTPRWLTMRDSSDTSSWYPRRRCLRPRELQPHSPDHGLLRPA